MAISLDEVNRISKLARLSFTDDEKQKLQHELSSILDYADQLKELQSRVEPNVVDEMDAINLMRDDIAADAIPEDFLAQAPSRQDNFIKVKSVLD